nr:hypothetical protein [Tanacetum cinerariifolium]
MSKSFESVQKHVINLELELQQCKEKVKNDMSFKVNKSKDFCKEREQYFEIQDLKAQLQDKSIAISELKKLIEKLKGKSVDTKIEKSSVIRQPNAFKSQRPSILGKPTAFANSFIRNDFSKSTSVAKNNVSNDFSKPVTAQTLPAKKKPCLKNTNMLAPGMYKIRTAHTQATTSKLPQDSKKTNKSVSFSTGVIPTTSVSRPQLKSTPNGDRVLRSDSGGKKLEVEEPRRNVKLSKNKLLVTACTTNLNAKTVNVKSVSAMCAKSDLKAQLQDKGIVISELKKLIEKLKGKSVDTKFEKSSVIRQPNAFKRVIPTTSVSRLQLKSNPQGDRAIHNNSQGNKKEVEDHRRSVKLSKNKTFVIACNDSLNAKTLNEKYVSAMCDKCVLIDKHDMCVLKSVDKL